MKLFCGKKQARKSFDEFANCIICLMWVKVKLYKTSSHATLHLGIRK